VDDAAGVAYQAAEKCGSFVFVPRLREGMCGWPPARKKKLQWVRVKSLAVMCPAFVVRSHDRWPRWEP
ncbi:MAG: hypothetical protein ACRDRB_24485, partial [Pseudonocardiaceae bacterium]